MTRHVGLFTFQLIRVGARRGRGWFILDLEDKNSHDVPKKVVSSFTASYCRKSFRGIIPFALIGSARGGHAL